MKSISLHDGQIPALTGLRGVGALLVVAYHLHRETVSPEFQILFELGAQIGIQIFFSLSGYILARIYCDEFLHQPIGFLEKYKIFIGKRIARIYPLHLFLLILLVIVLPSYHGREDGMKELLTNLTLTHGWTFDGMSFIGASWSISVEFLFYLIFPFMVILLTKLNSLLVFIMYAALFYVYTHTGMLPEASHPYLGHRIFSYGIFFVFGVGIFYLSRSKWVQLILDNEISFILIFLGLTLVYSNFVDIAGSVRVELAALMIPLLVRASHTSKIAGYLLGSTLMVWLGELSYSIYLSHQLLYNIFITLNHNVNIYIWYITFYIFLIICCLFLYHFIEVPARKKFRSILC